MNQVIFYKKAIYTWIRIQILPPPNNKIFLFGTSDQMFKLGWGYRAIF